MSRKYICVSPRRKLKPDPNQPPITNHFKTPTKADKVEGVKKSVVRTPSPKRTVKASPTREMKQLSLVEMTSPKKSNDRETSPISRCKKKLELVPVVKRLPDLITKSKFENNININNVIQNKNQDESKNNNGSESDDDLPECLINESISSSQESVHSPSKSASMNFKPRNYKFDINNILLQRETMKESSIEIKKMEEELKNGVVTLDDDSNVLEQDKFSLKNLLYKVKNDIKQEPPGIDLFDLTKCFQLYTTPPPLKHPENIQRKKFDELFGHVKETYSFFRIIKLARLNKFSDELSERPWILSYIFHVMSSNMDADLIHSCYRILDSVKNVYQKQSRFNWKPTVKDFVAVLVNCGIDADKLSNKIGKIELNFSALKEEYLNLPSPKVDNNQLIFLNLPLVFQTMTLYVQIPDAYTDAEKASILYLAFSVAADKQITDVYLLNQIQCSIGAVISNFSEPFWSFKMNQVVKNILTISSHHHDKVYIAQLMPYTTRGHDFVKLFSFLALTNLLEVQVHEGVFNVQISNILIVCTKRNLAGIKDYYKLHSALELMNFCITCELENESMTQEDLEQLKRVLRDTSSKLIDQIYDWDITIVKNLMTQMMGRLSLLKDTLPSNQKTLFQYKTEAPTLEIIPSSHDAADDVEY